MIIGKRIKYPKDEGMVLIGLREVKIFEISDIGYYNTWNVIRISRNILLRKGLTCNSFALYFV